MSLPTCPHDFDEWQKANLFAVLPTISLCDNHILTVQMRKWLIGPVINIMSYYPGQRNYFIKPRLYLSVFTYAPVPLISQFLPITREITVSLRSAATRWLVWSRGNMIGYKLFPFVLENAYSWVSNARLETQWVINFTEQYVVTQSSERQVADECEAKNEMPGRIHFIFWHSTNWTALRQLSKCVFVKALQTEAQDEVLNVSHTWRGIKVILCCVVGSEACCFLLASH